MSGPPIVIAYHLIWTAYGWWLPNDPRGSGSKSIDADILTQLGELHYGRKRIQPPGDEIRDFYTRAKPLLKHPTLTFDVQQINLIAASFAGVIAERTYTCYACAVLPDHAHLCLRKHRDQSEEMITHLKHASRSRLSALNHVPQDHPIWSGGAGWKVFLDHPDEVRRTINYINRNPRTPQRWGFVKPYDNWPLHEGHSPNSPYAKALKRAGRYP